MLLEATAPATVRLRVRIRLAPPASPANSASVRDSSDGGVCVWSYVKDQVVVVNSIFNGARREGERPRDAMGRAARNGIRARVPDARFDLIYPFGGRVPHRYGRESRRPARMLTALGQSCAGAGGGGVFSREHCGQALVRHADESVHLAKFPGKLSPGIARIGAAEDLTVDATGKQKIGVGSVRGQVPDRAVGASGSGRVSQVCPRSRERCSAPRPPMALSPLPR